MWKDKDNFDKIDIETYQEIYKEVKTRYEEQLSQSENVTDKVMKMILAVSAISVWAASVLSKIKIDTGVLILACSYLFGLICYLVSFFFPKPLILRGTSTVDFKKGESDLMGDIGGENFDKEQRKKIFYFQQLQRYDRRIVDIKEKNKCRANKYFIGICLSLGFLFLIIIIFAFYSPLVSLSGSSSGTSLGPPLK